jgi:uncharacterized protein
MSYSVLIRGALDGLGDSMSVSDTLVLDEVRLGEDVFRAMAPVSFSVTLSNVGEAIIAEGEVRGRFRTSCIRCLCEFDADFVADVDGFFVQPEDEAGLPEEQDRQVIVDDRIDLEPVIVESLVVEFPFAPLCSLGCAGICPTCGEDLNMGVCGCAPEAPASPFEGLRGAFPPEGPEHEGRS